jgi:hypothetical protein
MHLLVSTNRQVVTDVLGMLGVIDANETASIEDASLGLRQMNDAFALLAADGIDLGYPPQDNLSDEFPLDGTIEAQVKPILAMSLLIHYPSARPFDTLPQVADGAMSQLRRAAVLANMEESSLTHMPLGERRACVFDISSGE